MYGKFGGTGKLANWNGFARWQNLYKTKNWILAGGLSSQNIESAVKATQAKLIDVNSGVENSPGVKDHSLLKEFLTIIS
jgi:phosphoribosylanthranilate isomerase